MNVIVKSLEETLSQVHVTNWVDCFFEVDASWELTVSVAPVVFNAFHVPLVDNSDDFFALALVNVSEEIFITFVNEDFLESGEENVSCLNVPVDKILIKAFFSKGLGSRLMKFLSIGSHFITIW